MKKTKQNSYQQLLIDRLDCECPPGFDEGDELCPCADEGGCDWDRCYLGWFGLEKTPKNPHRQALLDFITHNCPPGYKECNKPGGKVQECVIDECYKKWIAEEEGKVKTKVA